MERPDTAIAIIKDFCPTSGAEVEGYINQLESDLHRIPAIWYRKGQESIRRKNESGCCCIINDDDEVERPCGAHQEWLESRLAAVTEELIQAKEKLEKILRPKCPECGSEDVYYENPRTGCGTYACCDCGHELTPEQAEKLEKISQPEDSADWWLCPECAKDYEGFKSGDLCLVCGNSR
jgi:predicted RNA-binding Zn-ribbon protein involved in translation (DUF1610 family)